jgi:hypothetical protein
MFVTKIETNPYKPTFEGYLSDGVLRKELNIEILDE